MEESALSLGGEVKLCRNPPLAEVKEHARILLRWQVRLCKNPAVIDVRV